MGQRPAVWSTAGELKATRRESPPQCSFPELLHLPRSECDQDLDELETTS